MLYVSIQFGTTAVFSSNGVGQPRVSGAPRTIITANTLLCLKDLILHIRSKKKFHQCHQSAETDVKTWTNEISCVWIPLKAKKEILEIFTLLLPDVEYILLTVTFLALKFPRHQHSRAVCFSSSGFQFNGTSIQVPSSDIDWLVSRQQEMEI